MFQTRRCRRRRTLRTLRLQAGLVHADAIEKLSWRKTRASLLQAGRVAITQAEVIALADLYKVSGRCLHEQHQQPPS
jgi:hypothetical protein